MYCVQRKVFIKFECQKVALKRIDIMIWAAGGISSFLFEIRKEKVSTNNTLSCLTINYISLKCKNRLRWRADAEKIPTKASLKANQHKQNSVRIMPLIDTQSHTLRQTDIDYKKSCSKRK